MCCLASKFHSSLHYLSMICNHNKVPKVNAMAPFNAWCSTVSKLMSHYEETVYFLPLRPQEFVVLSLSTSKRWLNLGANQWFWNRNSRIGNLTPNVKIEYVMCFAIWYHLYNLKNAKNTHGRVLLLVKLLAKSIQLYSE